MATDSNTKSFFKDEEAHSFKIKYEGPSFKNNTYDLGLLSKQLVSLDEMIDQSLKGEIEDNVKLKKEIKLERGSIIEEITILCELSRGVGSLGLLGFVTKKIIERLNYYCQNKNETLKKESDIENIVNLIQCEGDIINISGGTNHFHLPYKEKDEYIKRARPVEKIKREEVRDFIGTFQKIDLHNKAHSLGVDIEGIKKTNIPAKVIDEDPKTVPLDEKFKIKAKVIYTNNDEIVSVEIMEYKEVNAKLFS